MQANVSQGQGDSIRGSLSLTLSAPMAQTAPAAIRVKRSQQVVDGNTKRMLQAGRLYPIRADRAGWAGFVSPQTAKRLVEAGQAAYEGHQPAPAPPPAKPAKPADAEAEPVAVVEARVAQDPPKPKIDSKRFGEQAKLGKRA